MSATLDEQQDLRLPSRSWLQSLGDLTIGLLAALQFLTIIPLMRRPFTPMELGRAVGWFPLVGFLLGAGLAGIDRMFGWLFPQLVTATLLLAVWILATGALHLDGFLDTCDGLFGGQTPEARLRIMRDERVGAFAVTGGILLLLVKASCLGSLASRSVALIVTPVVARWGMALAVISFPYARSEGTGRWMKDHAGWLQAVLATLTVLVIAVPSARWLGLVVIVLAAVVTGVAAGFVLRRLPGFTGDVYGALCEILELGTLLVIVAGEKA